MRDRIDESLREITAREGIRILLAVESGSRGWGFPSTDSDFDVRFLFVYPLDWYLSLDEGRDVIEFESEDTMLDLNGWELRKALRLLRKGNAAAYEWLQSPIQYAVDDEFRRRTWEFAPAFFPLKAGLHHYLGLVKGVSEDLSAPEVKVKRAFYGLRAALAARWIVERKGVPPMTFDELKEPLLRHRELASFIEELRAEKLHQTEAFRIAPPAALRSFLEETINEGSAAFAQLPDPVTEAGVLDDILRLFIHGGGARGVDI